MFLVGFYDLRGVLWCMWHGRVRNMKCKDCRDGSIDLSCFLPADVCWLCESILTIVNNDSFAAVRGDRSSCPRTVAQRRLGHPGTPTCGHSEIW